MTFGEGPQLTPCCYVLFPVSECYRGTSRLSACTSLACKCQWVSQDSVQMPLPSKVQSIHRGDVVPYTGKSEAKISKALNAILAHLCH